MMKAKPRKYKKPLKRSLSGMEIECFTLDNSGKLVFDVDKIIKHVAKKHPEVEIRKECCKSMLELGSFPTIRVYNTGLDILQNLEKVITSAEDLGLHLLPHGTYPGKVNPIIRSDKWYKFRMKLFGEEKFLQAGLCCGFHYHYTLPRGVFDKKTQFLKMIGKSRIKKTLMDSYNLGIAMDPVLTTLLQSSPFAQGKYIARDSRMLLYRGGQKLGYRQGLYGKYQILGGLPPYKQTLSDLMLSIHKRKLKLKSLLKLHNFNPGIIKDSNVLNFTWNPVKINKLGTLELRGMDMNHPQYLIAASVFLKFIFKKVQQEFLHVMPSDTGIDEPFKIEDNLLYIPAHTHVRNNLQKYSAYDGLYNKEMYKYVKRFIRFAKSCSRSEYKPVVKPLVDIMEKKETVSDKMVKWVKRKGYSRDRKLPQSLSQELALKFAKPLLKEVQHTKAMLEKVVF
ncbi:glutamate-cysteine ligase family protein [Nanoarchaeota archaeon]